MNRTLANLWSNKWQIALPVVVLVAGFGITTYMMETKPGARRAAPPPAQARLVDVIEAHHADHQVVLEAYGEVKPRQDVAVKPQVAGEIIKMSDALIPGGRLKKGDLLVEIEPRDYRLAVARAESALAKAKATLAREEGNQTVAREEYEFLGQDLSGAEKDLVLRKPQLDTAKADVDAAQAALDEAKLDLERTRIVAPFDALVVSENVDVGTRVATNDVIANLVGTESYWVELAVPSNQLRWLDSPTTRRQQPSQRGDPSDYVTEVKLYNPGSWASDFRVGRLARVLGNLTSEGRMARVLVEIPDPLAQLPEDSGKPIVLIGSYLRAEVAGRTLENVVAVDRAIVHDGDRLWIMNARDELEFRDVHVAFSNKEQIFIDQGLSDGERIVATDIPTAAEGMPLRTSSSGPGTGSEGSELLGRKETGDGQGA